MLRSIIHIFIISGLLFFESCLERKEGNPDLIVVDIESNIKNIREVNLSEFAYNVKYVPLESVVVLPQISQIEFSDGFIVVTNAKQCLLYDSTGLFIREIGKQGRGPGEYRFILNMDFGRKKNIYISFMYDLLEYNMDGTFINEYKNIFLIEDKYIVRTWHSIDDSLFLGRIPNSTGRVEYKAAIIDKKGIFKKYYKNFDLFDREREVASGHEGFSHIYQFNGHIYYKELYNDTLFSLKDNFDLTPEFFFNLGKYKEPNSERIKIPPGDMWRYIYLLNVFQTPKFLLLRMQFGYHFPAKRITPIIPPYPVEGLKPTWYNTSEVLGLFNKESGGLEFCQPTNTDNPLFTTGFFNDIDAGPKFFPKKQVNDSTMVMWIEATQFKNHIASDDFKKIIPKYPDMKKKLEELGSKISEFDNPILMFVTFNK